MNTKRKIATIVTAIALICTLSSCVVVVHGHRHYWHHGFHRGY